MTIVTFLCLQFHCKTIDETLQKSTAWCIQLHAYKIKINVVNIDWINLSYKTPTIYVSSVSNRHSSQHAAHQLHINELISK